MAAISKAQLERVARLAGDTRQAAQMLGIHEESYRRACRRAGVVPVGRRQRAAQDTYIQACSTPGCKGHPLPKIGRCIACAVRHHQAQQSLAQANRN